MSKVSSRCLNFLLKLVVKKAFWKKKGVKWEKSGMKGKRRCLIRNGKDIKT